MDIVWWICAGYMVGLEKGDVRNKVLVRRCGKVVSLGWGIALLL